MGSVTSLLIHALNSPYMCKHIVTLSLTITPHASSTCEQFHRKVGSPCLIAVHGIGAVSPSGLNPVSHSLFFLLPVKHAVVKMFDFQRIIKPRTLCPIFDEMQISH